MPAGDLGEAPGEHRRSPDLVRLDLLPKALLDLPRCASSTPRNAGPGVTVVVSARRRVEAGQLGCSAVEHDAMHRSEEPNVAALERAFPRRGQELACDPSALPVGDDVAEQAGVEGRAVHRAPELVVADALDHARGHDVTMAPANTEDQSGAGANMTRHGAARRPRGPWARPRHHRPRRAAPARLADGPIGVYVGFDPTADSLHVGHLFGQLMLRRFQLAGHRPFPLAGGATGMVGDPGGRSEERNLLDLRHAAANVGAIKAQLERLLDFEPGPYQATLVNNADWTEPIGVLDFLRDVGKHITVNQMVAKESVRPRMDERARHLLHRVQLHAPAGLRLPHGSTSTTASSCRSAAPTSGATSPPASI